ncbi:MAG: dTDP-glucose 4,6-dehydratase [archaeon]|nr:dTDP-glucose 4,6-dehydratase [archaeon]
MRLLVTGGAGFIGSNFIRSMLNKYQDIQITNLDKLTYCGNLENLKDVEKNKNYKFVKGDIADKELVAKLMKETDEVVHFAAETHVDRSLHNAEEFLQTDVVGTFVLLEEARKNNVKKFVQISTDEVYGHILEGEFSEESVLNPRNPYSAAKAAADRLAYAFSETYGLNVSITRASNNFGAYQFPEKVIPLFATNLIQGKKVPLYGEGKNIRDWLYVLDNCEAVDLVRRKGAKGEAYNVGGIKEITNKELTMHILKLFEKGNEMIEFVPDRLGHDLRYSLNCEKIKELGWKPKHEFDSALKQTIDWYKSNEHWWKPLIEKAKFKRVTA